MPSEFSPTLQWPCRFTCDVSTYSPTATGLAVGMASDILWGLTGRQFGYTTATLRPCRRVRRDTPYPDAWLSWPGTQRPPLGATSSGGYMGYWMPGLCGSCDGGCSCSAISEVRLPAPVHSITTITVDGIILAPTSYRIDDGRILVRTDGVPWPRDNNIALDDTNAGTWSVTAAYGAQIPFGAENAVGELACELLRAMNGEDCRLPRTVTQLARQGVTITMPDPSAMFKAGLTGLYMTDLFIKTWNPGGLRTRARIYSVDTPTARRVGT